MTDSANNKTVALATLGCKLNQAESELLAGQFAAAGYRLVDFSQPADIYVVNTCTVTRMADAKCRRLIREAVRQHPLATVMAVGCYARRAPNELASIEGLQKVVSGPDKSQILSLLGMEIGSAASQSGNLRTRTLVKVQDGCNDFCSYCIVPVVRGREHSLPPDEIVEITKARIDSGYVEVVLTGTKIGSYSRDGADLKRLLERILKDTGMERLRLSSLQPQELSAGLLDLWADPRLCRHFHLALQSGSDNVLHRMGRRYSAGEFREAVGLLRQKVPGAAITTDVIVGFPGESDQDFQQTYSMCQELEFARIHVFPYSQRSGTRAARMPDQIPGKAKRERAHLMLELARSSAVRFRERFLGQLMPVLWEGQSSKGVWSGLTDNYIRVFTDSQEDLTNQLLPTRLEALADGGVWGKVASKQT